jgi:hypothetical protein
MRQKKMWSLVMAALFVLGIILLYSSAPAVKLFKTVEEQDIHAGAYFYTELEQTYEAESHIRQSMENSKWNKPIPVTIAIVVAVALIAVIFFIGYKYLP